MYRKLSLVLVLSLVTSVVSAGKSAKVAPGPANPQPRRSPPLSLPESGWIVGISGDAGSSGSETEPDPGLDPTVLHSRVKLTNEFIDQEFDASQNTTKLNLSYGFGRGERRDWTVQLDLPLVAYRAGLDEDTSDATGVGDVEMRLGHVFDGEGVFRWALGVETQFNTAAEPQLGDGVFRLSPAVVFAVQSCRAFKFQTTTQFNQSLATDADVSELQEIESKPALTFFLPAKFYAYIENRLKWNLREDGEFSAKLKFELGRGFGRRAEWVLSARYEMPLTESSDNHCFTVGCACVFP